MYSILLSIHEMLTTFNRSFTSCEGIDLVIGDVFCRVHSWVWCGAVEQRFHGAQWGILWCLDGQSLGTSGLCRLSHPLHVLMTLPPPFSVLLKLCFLSHVHLQTSIYTFFIVTLLGIDQKCGWGCSRVCPGVRDEVLTPGLWRATTVFWTCHRVETEGGAEQSKSALRVIEGISPIGTFTSKTLCK